MYVKELCEKARCSPAQYVELNSGEVSPINLSTGETKPHVLRIAAVLDAELYDLFPAYFCALNEYKSFPVDEIVSYWHNGLVAEDPVDVVETKDNLTIIYGILSKLPYNDRFVLEHRIIHDLTFEEISVRLGKSRERIRQIEIRGLRKFAERINKNKKVKELRSWAG